MSVTSAAKIEIKNAHQAPPPLSLELATDRLWLFRGQFCFSKNYGIQTDKAVAYTG